MGARITMKDVVSDLRYSVPINELELAVRAWKALVHANIAFVGELIEWSEPQLLKLDNFGRRSLLEVREVLGSIGLELSTTILDKPNSPDEFLNILEKNRGRATAEYQKTFSLEGKPNFHIAPTDQAPKTDAARLPERPVPLTPRQRLIKQREAYALKASGRRPCL